MLRNGEVAVETVMGYSNQGLVEYALFSRDSGVRLFLSMVLAGCDDFKSHDPSKVRSFIRRIEPFLESQMQFPNGFNEENLWKMVLYLKGNTTSEYDLKTMITMGFYLFRYVLREFPGTDFFPGKPLLKEAVIGKELITFAIQSYTGNEEVVIARSTGSLSARTLILGLTIKNPIIRQLYIDFFTDGFPEVRGREFNLCHKDFEKSFGPYAESIQSISDLSANVFWYQINEFYKPLYKGKKKKTQLTSAIHHVIDFYRFVTSTARGCHIFDSSSNLSATILRKKSFINYILDDRQFVPYCERPQNPTMGKAVVVFKNCGDINTRICEDECVLVDFSSITCMKYREMAWNYVFRDYSASSSSHLGYLAQALEQLYQVKQKNSVELTVLKASEARIIRQFFVFSHLSENTLASVLNYVKRFFDWAIANEYFTHMEPLAMSFFRYRLSISPKSKKNIKAIPADDANAILKYFADRAADSYYMKMCYGITVLLATTQFRISQICQIDINKIRLLDTEKGGMISGITKVNSDDRNESVTTKETVTFLRQLIRDSEDVREECYDKILRRRLFIYKGSTGFVRITDISYKEEMAKACRILNLRPWSPNNFRHMFATFTDEIDYKEGGDGTRAALVMNHKSYKTTHDNYVDHTYEAFKNTEQAFEVGTEDLLAKELNELLANRIDK